MRLTTEAQDFEARKFARAMREAAGADASIAEALEDEDTAAESAREWAAGIPEGERR